ncbi:NUMOD3 domain-containing DNA-binding protein [Streptomyces sp. NPDC056161]|uniref:NUMOD3 domain-containing DNA-binding protein n=1 Tax=Streptomyces sp. NPDC056161 TaxID=3345732 RepID=UPI0035D8F3DD
MRKALRVARVGVLEVADGYVGVEVGDLQRVRPLAATHAVALGVTVNRWAGELVEQGAGMVLACGFCQFYGMEDVVPEEMPTSEEAKTGAARKGKAPWNKGKTLSAETRRKMSETRTGKTLSEAARRKIGEANKGKAPWNKGKTLSAETRRRMSETRTGKTLSEAARRKIGEASTGRTVSKATREKMSEAHKKRKLSQEAKKMRMDAEKGMTPSGETGTEMSGARNEQGAGQGEVWEQLVNSAVHSSPVNSVDMPGLGEGFDYSQAGSVWGYSVNSTVALYASSSAVGYSQAGSVPMDGHGGEPSVQDSHSGSLKDYYAAVAGGSVSASHYTMDTLSGVTQGFQPPPGFSGYSRSHGGGAGGVDRSGHSPTRRA